MHEININSENSIELALVIADTIKPPRNVLPTSPIKPLDGDQFQNKNANRADIKL